MIYKKNAIGYILFTAIIFASSLTYSQVSDGDFSNYLAHIKATKDSIFESKFGHLQAKSATIKSFDKAKLAAITNSYILFLEEDDSRANKAANINFLQNGTITGTPILGSNLEVGVFDGGKALTTHREFQTNGSTRIFNLESNITTQALSNHATAVSGFIAGNGLGTAGTNETTLGVVPNALIKTAGFADTANGSVFQKIDLYNIPISNHSYGVNFGWGIKNIDRIKKIVTLTFPADPNVFYNDTETFSGVYLENDYNYDYLVSKNNKLTIVKSAGNSYGEGPGAYDSSWTVNKQRYSDSSGYINFLPTDIVPRDNGFNDAYCIGTGSLAKNIIVVGAIDLPSSANDYQILSSSDIIRSYYSSVGPRKDGGIKPDIVAVGTDLYYPAATSTSAYSIGSGTSYAAPKVSGTVAALTQLQRDLLQDSTYFFDADQIKALLVHTAKESGKFPGPDNKYGWGALDAKQAAEVLIASYNNNAYFFKNSKQEGETFSKTISARPAEGLKVTLTWIDPPAVNLPTDNREAIESTLSSIVNDLDLRVIDTESNEVFYPWKLNMNDVAGAAIQGDNTVDNVEQIFIDTPIAGRNYRIEVSNKGQLFDLDKNHSATQAYTLLITGANDEVLFTEIIPSKKGIVVYPTISSSIVNIVSDFELVGVEVYDLTGKLVSTVKTKKVDISNLSSGLYILKIKLVTGEILTKKIIKK